MPSLPASFAASIAIHVAILVMLGVLLRAMPATVGVHRDVPSPLTADIIVQPDLSEEIQPMPPVREPLDAIREMLPPPIAPVSRNTPEPGLSTAPATIQANPQLVPVGKISYGFGNGARRFGADLAKDMAVRYPTRPARLPSVSGSLSALYPAKAAAEGRSQELSALLSIDADGRVVDIRVLPNDSAFVPAVIATLKNARFQPATIAGKAIPYWAVLDFTFTIDGPTGPDGKRLDR
jgi:outer membrane biosynthesis protein TonB